MDEAGTIARVRALRKGLIEPLVAEYRGRIVKLTGDGALVEFATAASASVGISIGDIILEEGDI